MNLALFASSLEAGGAERVLCTMANYWASRGHELSLITLSSEQSDFYSISPSVQRVGLALRAEAAARAEALWANWHRVKVLQRVLRRCRPDVVISFLDTSNVLAILAATPIRIPVVVAERVDPRQIELPQPWQWLRDRAYPFASALVIQTEWIRSWADRRVPDDRVFCIPNPAKAPASSDEQELPFAWPSQQVVVNLGRLTEQKAHRLLIDAFARNAETHPEWSLLILGEGELRGALERRVKQLGLRGRVVLPGRIKNVGLALRNADLFVLSSRFEGFPNALLEAMACGLPAISFDCPSGPSDIIRHGVDGLLVPTGDVDALARAMYELMSDDARRKRMAERAPEVLERFGLERVMGMWEELIEQVTGKKM